MHHYNSITTLFKVRHYRDPHGDYVHPRLAAVGWALLKGSLLLSLCMLSAGAVMAVFAFVWGLFA